MRVDGAQFSQVGPQADGAGGAATRGSWRGETLTVSSSPSSLLADAAEEMTFAQAEHEETKEVSERRVRSAGSTQIPQIQEIMAYLELLGDRDDQAKLEELTSKLRESRGFGGGQAARDAFGDVSQQFLALGYALRRFEDEDDAAAAATLREELEALVEDHGPAIQAGLNSAGAANAFAGGDAGRAAGFRECYRETVLGRESLGDTFNAILERFGAADTRRSIAFLIRAAGDDLAARGPSTAPAELRSIIEDLYQLEVLATVMEGCQALGEALARDFGVGPVDAERLTKNLIDLAGERWVSGDRVAALARDFQVREVDARIAFLTRTKVVLRDMPPKVFAEPESRDKLLRAAQDALDAAIEEEDA